MKVALIGAAGNVGSKILKEALDRGHQVTAVVRRPEALPSHPNLTARKAEVSDTDDLAEALKGHEAVICSFSPGIQTPDDQIHDQYVAAFRSIHEAVKRAGVTRYLAVGGAASLKTADDVELLNSPEFPAEFEAFRGGIGGTRAQYYLLKEQPELDWVFLAPSIWLRPGERTGAFRLGKDHVLYDADGRSHISQEDFSMAMIDELERPAHHRERFTVGY